MHPRAFRPPHRLCDGYTRGYACDPQAAGDGPVRAVGQGISGVVCRTANENVEVVKGKVWGDLLRLLGKGADTVMLGLLVDCGVFTILESGKDCFWQLSGESPLVQRITE